MSETVHYKGKAFRVDLDGSTNEEFALKYITDNGHEVPSYYDNALEYLVDRWSNHYFFYPRNKKLYHITKTSHNLEEEIISAWFDPGSDVINYELRYYNGGGGFDECLEEAFDQIIK